MRWSDVNWERRTLSVAQTIGPDDHGQPTIRARTKTEASTRTLDLDEACLSALHDQERMLDTQRREAGDTWRELGLVFPSHCGTPRSPRNLYRTFLRLVDLAGVPRISLHDLRHTHATLMIEQGAQIHVVAQRLGHKKVSTTMDIYVKVMPGQQREAAEAFGARLSQARETPGTP